MPTIDDINKKRDTKNFKKRDYRPWDIEGSGNIQNDYSVIYKQTDEDIVLSVEPQKIKNWEFRDRPENELGDIESLAIEFKEIGQQQPCIARPISDTNNDIQYELIVGERRWRAAQTAQINLKVIVKNLSDTDAAIIQASENLSRKGLSDYARGMSYAKLIDNGIITQKELTEKLSISKQQVSRLLSFSKIPQKIHNSIRDFPKVTCRTAEQIKQLSSKGENYIEAIIKFTGKIREGKKLDKKNLNC
ncbi:ParB family transcriptional regulator, chromosome partitioning protein [Alphaproteobacteria bacterium]